MQRRLCAVGSGLVCRSRWVYVTGGAPLQQQRVFQSSVAADAATTSTSTAAGGVGSAATPSVSSDTPSHFQQLYKSSHKGGGTTPMPRPYQERKLRSRRTPAAGADTATPSAATPSAAGAAAAAAPSPLFGARSSCAEDAGPVPQRALSPLQKRQLQFRSKAAFVLTPQALRRVKYLLAQFTSTAKSPPSSSSSQSSTSVSGEKPCGIRIGVRRRGCSGYSYTVNYYFGSSRRGSGNGAASSRSGAGGMEDAVVEQEGVKVVVDADALFYVIGTEMDYVVRNVEEKFTFKNPNQKYGCGCEESFMPFDADDMDDD
ncbi:Iron-sulfur assembly protein 1 [Novymonas esmeraldas]|uniref:Iron-sulfur assembly protein 1 n=1 Tax=Novymonas esmeraldas TaxID=1808958 RepID=A0AAW0EJ63_9TRYP